MPPRRHESFAAAVYARPEYIDILATSTPVAAHVPVDFELRGCPIDRRQLLEVISALLVGRKPFLTPACSRKGTVMSHRSRELTVSGLSRVEGEGALRLTVRDGQVERAELNIYEPPRRSPRYGPSWRNALRAGR